jgi:gluconate 2-dehydrogenase gamma chain
MKRKSGRKGSSRRSFLATSATGFGSAWLASNWAAIAEAQDYARKSMASGQPGKFEFLTPEQATEVECIASQIIPTDDTPGAKEVGCVYFIDRALTTFDRGRQPIYKEGLDTLQAKTRELFPNATKFSSLSSAQQIQVLQALEKTPFFLQVRAHTITGFFANPEYGGNKDKAGWNLIDFEGKFHYSPPFGYYDREPESASLTGRKS